MEEALLPVALRRGSSCGCANPRPVRFGELVLCVNSHCLNKWIWVCARKFRPARVCIGMIKKRGMDVWEDYLQFFRAYCWRRVVECGMPGISVYDISDSAKSFLLRKRHDDEYTPDANLTQPPDFSDECDSDHDLVHRDAMTMTSSDDPYLDVRISEILSGISDDLLALYLADQVTLADAALLSGTKPAAYAAYAEVVRGEIRR